MASQRVENYWVTFTFAFWSHGWCIVSAGYPCCEGSPPVHTVHWKEVTKLCCCSVNCVRLFVSLWTAVCQAFLSSAISWNLLILMSIESVMLSNNLVLCHPVLLLPSIFPSIRVFSNELALRIRWSKYWSFSFSISPYSGYSGLISFRLDWFDLLAVQETQIFLGFDDLDSYE